MKVVPTGFEGLNLLHFKKAEDERGSFSKLLDGAFFADHQLPFQLQQINSSVNKFSGTVRGFHYQNAPYTETKIITCLRGEVFDVVVDLRAKSKTFLKHFSIQLSEYEPISLIVPPGFAHGFQTLCDNSCLLYLHDQPYVPSFENGLNVADENLDVKWPLPFQALSRRDQELPKIHPNFKGIFS